MLTLAALLLAQVPFPSSGRTTSDARKASEAWANCVVAELVRNEPSERPVDAVAALARRACAREGDAFWRDWEKEMKGAGLSSAERRRMRAAMSAELQQAHRDVVLNNRPSVLLARLDDQIKARAALEAQAARDPASNETREQEYLALLRATDELAGKCWNQVTVAHAKGDEPVEAVVARARQSCAPFRDALQSIFALGQAIHKRPDDPRRAAFEADQIEQLRAERMRRGIANIRRAR